MIMVTLLSETRMSLYAEHVALIATRHHSQEVPLLLP
jgi:hypothetical protein